MTLAELLLPEFQKEMSGTRRVLEQLNDDHLDWKLNPKSNTVGWVANHLSDLPNWVTYALAQDELDFLPEGGTPYQSPSATSMVKILDRFDRNVAAGEPLLRDVTDESLMQPWRLLQSGRLLFELPRYFVIRTWVLNHVIHHRGNLCVYCRQLEVPVPALYGPSADEAGM